MLCRCLLFSCYHGTQSQQTACVMVTTRLSHCTKHTPQTDAEVETREVCFFLWGQSGVQVFVTELPPGHCPGP